MFFFVSELWLNKITCKFPKLMTLHFFMTEGQVLNLRKLVYAS